MKNFILTSAMILASMMSLAQNNNYTETMLKTLEMMDGSSGSEYLHCASIFERIALAEKDKWLPYYWGSLSMALMSLEETDGEKKDAVLDKAQELLDHALVIAPDESELHVLQAFIYPSRIMVDPMGRGMVYMEKAFASLETAKKLNPDNPRVYYLEAIDKLNIPSAMGGGAEVAKPIFQMADEKFRSFHNDDPLWPNWGDASNCEELAKLQ